MELVYYTPHRLYSYTNIAQIDPVQVSFSEMFNASISLIDRSGNINCPPVPIKVLDPMHEMQSPAMFDEIAYKRFNSILESAINQNKTLVIFYSGGIDSTLIAALAISHPDFEKYRHKMLLVLSEDSIKENPRFWQDYLISAFRERIANASGFHKYIADPNNVCVTGEFADNIFGSLTLKSYMDVTGDKDAIHKSFSSTGLNWLLNKIKNKQHVDQCRDLIEKILSTHPDGCNTNHDAFWWLNFVLKWQAVKFRLVSHAPSQSLVNIMAQNVVHFFETKEFQDWAVLTTEDKVEKSWFSYKLPAKKLIYSINKDIDYFRWKTKYPSIPSLTRYTNMFDFIYWDESNNTYQASKDYKEFTL
jgi:hypothetical protein